MCVALAVVDLILIASMNINTQAQEGRGWLIGRGRWAEAWQVA